MLQEEINKLCDKYPDFPQASATVKWNTKSLILYFKKASFDVKELVLQHFELQQKDPTLS